ncbi:MAG: hypothetical protein ABI923_03810 [bacterium]
MEFADSQRGYAVGARGNILRTDDGGATWKDVWLEDVRFLDDKAWACRRLQWKLAGQTT